MSTDPIGVADDVANAQILLGCAGCSSPKVLRDNGHLPFAGLTLVDVAPRLAWRGLLTA